MSTIQFNDMELLIIKELTETVIHFFPESKQIYEHAKAIRDKIASFEK